MKSILTLIIIGISLSMDAFSLSLVYGTKQITKKDKYILSLIVSIYHFIMPLLGILISIYIRKKLYINLDYIASIILIFLGISLITEKENNSINMNNYLLFGLSVSIDSLSLGIGLKAISNYTILPSIIFSITSLIFTYLGLNLGNYISKHLGNISTTIGGIVLIFISILIFINKY